VRCRPGFSSIRRRTTVASVTACFGLWRMVAERSGRRLGGLDLTLAQDLAEPALQGDGDSGLHRALIEALDERLEESLDDQALRLLIGETV
jgi:hypothetical protein